MPWFLCALLLMGLAWKCEGRWQLSEPAANSLGLVIAFGMLGWIIFQLPRNDEDLLAAGVPWPAGLLPHLGPLLMILTAVKLFRPKKVPDFWVLQILGVMMVTLASVLAGEADHGIWVFLYLVVCIWCLATSIACKAPGRGSRPKAVGKRVLFTPQTFDASASVAHEFSAGLGAAAVWSLVIAGLGPGLFLLAPRHASVQWMPHKLSAAAAGRVSTGVAAGMDLNRVGKIELSDEVAFEVSTAQRRRAMRRHCPATSIGEAKRSIFIRAAAGIPAGRRPILWPALAGERQRRLATASLGVRCASDTTPNDQSPRKRVRRTRRI